jgi:hypothetical protein
MVRQAGKLRMIIQIYDEDHVDRGTLLKKATRHISEITAIASKFGDSAKVIVPRSCDCIPSLCPQQ